MFVIDRKRYHSAARGEPLEFVASTVSGEDHFGKKIESLRKISFSTAEKQSR